MTGKKERIGLHRAIERMRELSAAGATFSLEFRKYNRATGLGGGKVTISAARLRPAAREEQVRDSEHKLFFTDTESKRQLNCWRILITGFNGHPVVGE